MGTACTPHLHVNSLLTVMFAVLSAASCASDDLPGAKPDLTSDPENCGEFNHSCLGGACSDSKCLPTLVVETLDNLRGILQGFTVANTHIFFDIWSADTDGWRLYRSDLVGTPPVFLADESVEAYAFDATSAYWTTSRETKGGGRGLVRYPLDGGTPRILAPPGFYPGLAVKNGYAYFTDGEAQELKRVAITGGQVVVLASALHGPREVVVDEANVYWIDSARPCGLMKIPLAGGERTVLAADQCGSYRGITVDESHVYWTNLGRNGSSGSVMKVPLAGGPVVTLAIADGTPRGIAVDDDSVYWVEAGAATADHGPSGALKRVSLSGGEPEVLFAGGGMSLVALSNDAVYFDGYIGVFKLAK